VNDVIGFPIITITVTRNASAWSLTITLALI
jgi:hypothetical protein